MNFKYLLSFLICGQNLLLSMGSDLVSDGQEYQNFSLTNKSIECIIDLKYIYPGGTYNKLYEIIGSRDKFKKFLDTLILTKIPNSNKIQIKVKDGNQNLLNLIKNWATYVDVPLGSYPVDADYIFCCLADRNYFSRDIQLQYIKAENLVNQILPGIKYQHVSPMPQIQVKIIDKNTVEITDRKEVLDMVESAIKKCDVQDKSMHRLNNKTLALFPHVYEVKLQSIKADDLERVFNELRKNSSGLILSDLIIYIVDNHKIRFVTSQENFNKISKLILLLDVGESSTGEVRVFPQPEIN